MEALILRMSINYANLIDPVMAIEIKKVGSDIEKRRRIGSKQKQTASCGQQRQRSDDEKNAISRRRQRSVHFAEEVGEIPPIQPMTQEEENACFYKVSENRWNSRCRSLFVIC